MRIFYRLHWRSEIGFDYFESCAGSEGGWIMNDAYSKMRPVLKYEIIGAFVQCLPVGQNLPWFVFVTGRRLKHNHELIVSMLYSTTLFDTEKRRVNHQQVKYDWAHRWKSGGNMLKVRSVWDIKISGSQRSYLEHSEHSSSHRCW